MYQYFILNARLHDGKICQGNARLHETHIFAYAFAPFAMRYLKGEIHLGIPVMHTDTCSHLLIFKQQAIMLNFHL